MVSDKDIADAIREAAPGDTFDNLKAAWACVRARLCSRDDDRTEIAFGEVLARYEATLTAPAEGDAEAADPDELTAEIERLVREMKPADRYPFIRYKIAAALTTARKDAEARVKALEAENLGLRKTVGVDGKEIAELRADLAAALLAGEGKGEE